MRTSHSPDGFSFPLWRTPIALNDTLAEDVDRHAKLSVSMTAQRLFSNLLISAPNVGAFFAVRNGQVYRLDSRRTTGLYADGATLLRGVQPDTLEIYGDGRRTVKLEQGELLDIHDVGVFGGEIYVIGTHQNIVVKLGADDAIAERWVLAGDPDSAHLNCLASWNGRIVYSCFGRFQEHRGYKGASLSRGLVCDLSTNEVLIEGLSQPHSPTSLGSNLLIANSELHELCEYSPQGELLRTKAFENYTRGICVDKEIIYVGLSTQRPKDPGIPHIHASKVAALDRTTWDVLGELNLSAPEIYSIISPARPALELWLLQIAAGNEASRQTAALAEKSRCDAVVSENSVHKAARSKSESDLARLHEKMEGVLSSASWRATHPLRQLAQAMRRIARN